MDTEHSVAGQPDAVLAGFDNAPMLALLLEGPELRIVAINRVARGFVHRQDSLGCAAGEIFPGPGNENWLSRARHVLWTGEPVTGVSGRVTPIDLTTGGAWVQFRMDPWRAADGSVRGVVASSLPDTDRTHGESTSPLTTGRSALDLDRRVSVAAVQEAMLPTKLPVLPGVQLAARYLLAADHEAAGGDWFDVVPRAGSVALVVGDVVGNGLRAAAAMGQLRAVLRDHLGRAEPIPACLAQLQRFAEAGQGARSTTLCVVALDLASGRMTYCTAGHPPPMILRRGAEVQHLPPSGAGPLGSAGGFTLAEDCLEPDDVLMLYSDGALEAGGRNPAADIGAVMRDAAETKGAAAAAGSRLPQAVDQICGRMVESMIRVGAGTDDVTLLAARRVPIPRGLRVQLPGRAEASRELRRTMGEWLAGIGVTAGQADVVHHAVGELFANAVEHAYVGGHVVEDTTICVEASLNDDGCVQVAVADRGRWREEDGSPTDRANGLVMASDLVDRVDVDRGRDGTIVTLRHRPFRRAWLATSPAPGSAGWSRGEGSARGPAASGDAAPGDPARAAPQPAFGMEVTAAPRTRIAVSGPVDINTAGRLRWQLLRSSRGGVAPLTVDLERVTQLASAGVEVLMEAVERSQRQGVELIVQTSRDSTAQRVLDVVALPYDTRVEGRPGVG